MARFRSIAIAAAGVCALLTSAHAEPVSQVATVASALRTIRSAPSLSTASTPLSKLEASVCVNCQTEDASAPSLLHAVNYFLDPKKLELVPRTREAAGELLPVGMIDRDGKSPAIATGFLITECHVLTNLHAVFSNVYMRQVGHDRLPPINFYYGQGKDHSFAGHVRAVRAVAWGNAPPGLTTTNVTNGEDWAILRLEHCIGTDIGYLEILAAPEDRIPDAALNIFGMLGHDYSRGFHRDSNCSYGAGGRLLSDKPGTGMMHYCSASKGASGSPIYITYHGHPVVVGMNASESQPEIGNQVTTRERAYNGGVLLHGMYDRMVVALTSSPEKEFIVQQTGQEWRPRAKLEKWVAEDKVSP